MNDFITSHERVLDKVKIDEIYEYSVFTTLGIAKEGDYYIKLEFIDINFDDLRELISLYKLPRELKFSSELAHKLDYKITHIVVTNMSTTNEPTMIWQCLSDNPELCQLILDV